jgi:hypothetical protein
MDYWSNNLSSNGSSSMLVPVLLLVSQVSIAQQPQTAQDSGLTEDLFSDVLVETP